MEKLTNRVMPIVLLANLRQALKEKNVYLTPHKNDNSVLQGIPAEFVDGYINALGIAIESLREQLDESLWRDLLADPDFRDFR